MVCGWGGAPGTRYLLLSTEYAVRGGPALVVVLGVSGLAKPQADGDGYIGFAPFSLFKDTLTPALSRWERESKAKNEMLAPLG